MYKKKAKQTNIRIWNILNSNLNLHNNQNEQSMEQKSIHSENYRIVIQNLRNIRESKGITQAQLAKKIGCNQTVVSKIETMERRIDIIELRSICHSLDVDVIEFITNIEKKLI